MTSKTHAVVSEVRSSTDGYEVVIRIGDVSLALVVDYAEARRVRVGDTWLLALKRVPKGSAL